MSRVFISTAYRDREVGEQVGGILRDLGHEPVDDRDDERGTAWWNEVVGRIETCETFVAVVSAAYADTQACRREAKHAAATGLPVVRLDVGGKAPTSGLHPAVRSASPVRFGSDDSGAVKALERALDRALAPDPPAATEDEQPALSPEPPAAPPREAAPADASPEPPPDPPSDPPADPPADPPPSPLEEPGRLSGAELVLALVMIAMALALVMIVGPALVNIVGGDGQQATADPGAPSRGKIAGAEQDPGPSPSVEQSEPPPSPAGDQAGSPEAQQLLTAISELDSDRLPASSCAAGDGHVTCRDPAPNIDVVVLTPYSSQEELYDAYTDAVAALSADPMPENIGDCTASEYEGEFAWNLDLGRYDISIDTQSAGGLDHDDEAAGRLFCTEATEAVRLVWTQDPGMLLAAKGRPAPETIGWWRGLHLDLGCAAGQTGTGCTEDRT